MKVKNPPSSSLRPSFVEVSVRRVCSHEERRSDKKKDRPRRDNTEITAAAKAHLVSIRHGLNDTPITRFSGDPILTQHVESIVISQHRVPVGATVSLDEAFFQSCAIRLYQLYDTPPHAEELSGEDDEEGSGDNVTASHTWELPNVEFEGLWDSLIFETDAKEKILSYAFSMMRFADHAVDSTLVTANRLILLHGPPGTGKTTLCRAAAQKLAIRMSERYSKSVIVEINSHSLFSKFFSESGKLVMKMFERIHCLLDDPSRLVFVLIDEVESLTVARKSSMAANEPSDAVRVVNALLTQIDFIRRWPNVLILTTSNLANAVDPAFLDRADFKQFIPPPSKYAIYAIYLSCIKELQRASIIDASIDLSPDPRSLGSVEPGAGVELELSKELLEISEKSGGVSGRTLRKLPVLADSFCHHQEMTSLKDFLDGLSQAVDQHMISKRNMDEDEPQENRRKERKVEANGRNGDSDQILMKD